MNKEESYYEQSLQNLDYEFEWKPHRSQVVRKRLKKNIQKMNTITKIQRVFTISISFVLAVSVLFVMYGQISGQLNLAESAIFSSSNTSDSSSKFIKGVHYNFESINGQKVAVLTKKGKESSVYPTDAYKTNKTIVGEPDIHLSITKHGKEEVFETQAIYTTTTAGQNIYIHTQRHNDTIDQRIEMLLPHSRFPSSSYSSYELEISNHSAVMQEAKTEIGQTYLYVVTDKYIYSIYSNGMNDKDSKINPQELINIANLINFENEK